MNSFVIAHAFYRLSSDLHVMRLIHCVLQNTVRLTKTFIEEKLKPPTFVKQLEPISSKIGSKIRFQCVLSGSSPIDFHWFKNDKEVTTSPGSRVQASTDTTKPYLEIDNTKIE